MNGPEPPAHALVHGILEMAEIVASTRPIDERVTAMCRATVELLGCDRSSVFVLEDGRHRARYNHGNPPDIASRFESFNVGTRDPLVREMFRTGTYVVVNDIPASSLVPDATAEAARITAIVAAPMLDADDRPLGFITAEYNETIGDFDEVESTLVLGVARLCSVALVAERQRRERLELEERLAQAERIESLGRLAGGVAHDFNNLLSVILGSVDLLRLRRPGDALIEQELGHIESAGTRGAELTRELLATGRRQMVAVTTVDVATWLSAAEPLVRRAIREDVELGIFVGGAAAVRADPVQLDQMLLNLVLNASESMPRGGRLTIETSVSDIGDDDAVAHDIVPGRYVVLAVTDTGGGMDVDTQRRAFDPFFSTKQGSGGSGLGLASVYGAVKQNGGHVTLYSEPGVGTVVKVYLPIVQVAVPAAAAVEVPTDPAPEPALPGGTVLVVEDDPGLRRLVGLTVERLGFEVLLAEDGHGALAFAERHEGEIDLLLSDVVIPGPNGRELVRLLMASRPDIRVLFMSGYAENSIVHQGYVDLDVAFIPKPFTSRQLAAKLHEVFHRDVAAH